MEGAKGQRYYDWACFGVRVKDEDPAAGFAHTLLIRRSISDPTDVAYFLVHVPVRTPVAVMVAVAGVRWKIEENNEQGKDLIGLDPYQVRTWTSWHHYVTACMFAHAFAVVQRAHLADAHADVDPGQAPARGGRPGERPPAGVGPTAATPESLDAEWLAQATVADVRNLLAGLVLTVDHGRAHRLHWFAWRLIRKVRAQVSRYRRRGDPLPAHLQRWIRSHPSATPP
jgi:hypothetical protein